ncbi:precorrin-4 C11-methyltransferase [Mycobacteroides abscessus subsp. abscessus]|nr:precorrin-4 C11-methyltransferase [Mycobacteroides abscessus subsp. abscessus]
MVHRASQPEELVLRGTLADIADRVEAAGLRQAAVILVGRALTPAVACTTSHLYDPGEMGDRGLPEGCRPVLPGVMHWNYGSWLVGCLRRR